MHIPCSYWNDSSIFLPPQSWLVDVGGFRQGKEALLGSFKGQVFLVYLDVAVASKMDVLKGTSHPSVMDQLGKLQRPHYDLTTTSLES